MDLLEILAFWNWNATQQTVSHNAAWWSCSAVLFYLAIRAIIEKRTRLALANLAVLFLAGLNEIGGGFHRFWWNLAMILDDAQSIGKYAPWFTEHSHWLGWLVLLMVVTAVGVVIIMSRGLHWYHYAVPLIFIAGCIFVSVGLLPAHLEIGSGSGRGLPGQIIESCN